MPEAVREHRQELLPEPSGQALGGAHRTTGVCPAASLPALPLTEKLALGWATRQASGLRAEVAITGVHHCGDSATEKEGIPPARTAKQSLSPLRHRR